MDADYRVGICLVGDSNVGKTSFFNLLLYNDFKNYGGTVGVDFGIKTFDYKDEDKLFKIKWLIWDTAGNSRFESIVSSYFRKITIYFLFLDLSEKSSFYNLEKWLKLIRINSNNNHKILLLGNKMEIKQEIDDKLIYNLCDEYNMDYFPISVKNKQNIDFVVDQANQIIGKTIKKYADEELNKEFSIVSCGEKKVKKEKRWYNFFNF